MNKQTYMITKLRRTLRLKEQDHNIERLWSKECHQSLVTSIEKMVCQLEQLEEQNDIIVQQNMRIKRDIERIIQRKKILEHYESPALKKTPSFMGDPRSDVGRIRDLRQKRAVENY
jgi:hypothetical protein